LYEALLNISKLGLVLDSEYLTIRVSIDPAFDLRGEKKSVRRRTTPIV